MKSENHPICLLLMYLGYIDFVIAQGGESDSFVVFFFFSFFSSFAYFHWHSTRLYNMRRPSRPEGVSRCIVDSRKANLHPHAHTHSSHHRCRRRRSCRRHRRLFSPLSFSSFLFLLENSRRSERKMTGSETCSFPVYSISFSSTTTTSFLSLPLSCSIPFYMRVCVSSMAASMCCPMKSDLLAIRRARVLGSCAHNQDRSLYIFLEDTTTKLN